jgi:hypothetical protein
LRLFSAAPARTGRRPPSAIPGRPQPSVAPPMLRTPAAQSPPPAHRSPRRTGDTSALTHGGFVSSSFASRRRPDSNPSSSICEDAALQSYP